MAEAYADYFALKDRKIEKYLTEKSHPAYTAAENVRTIKNEKRDLLKRKKITDYKINYYEKLFPWLTELIADNEDDEILVKMDDEFEDIGDKDRVRKLLTPEEYQKLSSVERNQRALDRYLEIDKNQNGPLAGIMKCMLDICMNSKDTLWNIKELLMDLKIWAGM